MKEITKQAFAKTLKQMMAEMPFHKITVVKLVKRCGVNRQTFYYHFQDIYDLLEWIYTYEALEEIGECRHIDSWEEGYLRVFYYVDKNYDFCMQTLKSEAREHLDGLLYRLTFQLMMTVIDEIVVEVMAEQVALGRPIAQPEKELIAKFYAHGFIGLVIDWMKEGRQEAPPVIICRLRRLIEGEIRRTIERRV